MSGDRWPSCPMCRNALWQGFVDSPQRVVRGCAHCGTYLTSERPTVDVALPEMALFDIEEAR
jgi:hypothetical protein